VAIAQKIPSGSWRERSHPVEVAVELLRHYVGQEDVYISTQRFRGRRRIAHLLSLGSLHMDLDFYQIPDLAGVHPIGVLEVALLALEKAAMPEPTLAIASGKGLYLLWLHGPIPRAALPRWTACQKALWEVLKHLGADRAAIDAARVLRVVGTIHSEARVVVETLAPVGEVMAFDDLAKKILPLDRAELRDLRVQRALRASQSRSQRLQAPPQGFTKATLWEARLSDLQRLREMRFMDVQMADYRERWMFLSGVAMSWLAVPAVLQRELYALAHQAGGWTEGHTRSKLQTVFRTAYAAARGEKVQYAGVEVDPRYRFKNQTIIELLEITADEEREMKTIISDEERRRRDRRRKNPEMTRQEYEGRAADRRLEARRMASEGMSRQEIAKTLGWSKRHVQRVLNEDSGEG
jgi:Homeodomain-like domain-containing protein